MEEVQWGGGEGEGGGRTRVGERGEEGQGGGERGEEGQGGGERGRGRKDKWAGRGGRKDKGGGQRGGGRTRGEGRGERGKEGQGGGGGGEKGKGKTEGVKISVYITASSLHLLIQVQALLVLGRFAKNNLHSGYACTWKTCPESSAWWLFCRKNPGVG